MSNILETTLAMLGIENYIKEFRRYGIDATVLPLLSNKDLKIIGIEDNELRQKILRQFSTLPIPKDMLTDLTVDHEYMLRVLNDMDRHLLLLNASLSFAYHVDNIKITPIKLTCPTRCLLQCIETFEKRTNAFYDAFTYEPVKKSNKTKYITITLLITTTVTAAIAITRCIK